MSFVLDHKPTARPAKAARRMLTPVSAAGSQQNLTQPLTKGTKTQMGS
jgi:hypothetical protein